MEAFHLLILFCCEVEDLVCRKAAVAVSIRTPDCFCLLTFLSSYQSNAIDCRENLDWTCIFSNGKEIKSQKKPVHKIQGDVSIILCTVERFFSFTCLVVYILLEVCINYCEYIKKKIQLLFGEMSPDAVVFLR